MKGLKWISKSDQEEVRFAYSIYGHTALQPLTVTFILRLPDVFVFMIAFIDHFHMSPWSVILLSQDLSRDNFSPTEQPT